MASFQRAIFLPFLDNLLEQIDAPFYGLSEVVLLGLLLIPANLQNLKKSSQKNLSILLSRSAIAKQFVTGTGAVEAALVWYFLLILQCGQPLLQWYCAEEPSIPCLEIHVCQCFLLFLGSTVSKHPWHCKRHCRPAAQASNPTTSQFCACCWLPQSKVQPLNVATHHCDMRRMFIAAPWKNAKPFHFQK